MIPKIIYLLILFVGLNTGLVAQKYFTKNGRISFFSKTSLENIKAENNQVINVLNTQSGLIQFSLIVKNFHFEKSLMEVHFNENYMESGRFPYAGFKGTIINLADVSFDKDGIYPVRVTGDMTIHGMVKKVDATGTITITGGKLSLASKFFIKITDYNISIPKLVIDKIAESIEVNVQTNFDQKM
ncbi:MAG: YceI family protein [Ferruginibacter sp.]